jgi:hypothetical protein
MLPIPAGREPLLVLFRGGVWEITYFGPARDQAEDDPGYSYRFEHRFGPLEGPPTVEGVFDFSLPSEVEIIAIAARSERPT